MKRHTTKWAIRAGILVRPDSHSATTEVLPSPVGRLHEVGIQPGFSPMNR